MNRFALPTIHEEDEEVFTTLTVTSPEGDHYVLNVDPHPTEEIYQVAATSPSGAVNAEGWLDETGVNKALQWWTNLIQRGGPTLRWLFEVDEDEFDVEAQ